MKCVFKNSQLLSQILSSVQKHVTAMGMKFTEGGLEVESMDSAASTMCHIKLSTDQFSFYQCEEPTEVNVDVATLLRILKIATQKHVLQFSSTGGQPCLLNIQFAVAGTKDSFDFDLKLMTLDEEGGLQPPPFEGDGWEVTVPAKIIKNKLDSLKNFGDSVMVGAAPGALFLKVEGDGANVMASTDANVRWLGEEGHEERIILKVSLLYLSDYTSSTTIAPAVVVKLKQDFPLVVTYNITDQSFVTYYIAPKIDDENNELPEMDVDK